MRSIQEIIFLLMILVGLSMILYDVINAKTVARTVERKIAQEKAGSLKIRLSLVQNTRKEHLKARPLVHATPWL